MTMLLKFAMIAIGYVNDIRNTKPLEKLNEILINFDTIKIE